MIAVLLALSLTAQVGVAPQSTEAPQDQGKSGAALISKMFALYAGAKTLDGSIHMSQSMSGHEITIDTKIAYEMPSKLFIRQQLNAAQTKVWTVTSDGDTFTYDVPNPRRWSGGGEARLWEAVSPAKGYTLTNKDIYQAASLSLGDKNIPEDVLMAGKAQLENVRFQLATVHYDGERKLKNETVNVVTGDWREFGKAPASAKYEMYITDDGQLRRYVQHDIVQVKGPGGQNLDPQQVVTEWDLDIKINSQLSETLFTVLK